MSLSLRRARLTVLAIFANIGWSHPALAEPSTQSTGEWGWYVVIPSLAAGAALTAYGLSVDCRESDSSCQRGAGVAIWGGVGIASFGSLLGISIVQAGQSSAGVALGGTLP